MASTHALSKNFMIAHSLAPQTVSGTVNGTGVDTLGWHFASMVVYVGALAAGCGVVVKVQESDDDGSTDAYTDVVPVTNNVPYTPTTTAATTGSLIDAVADNKHMTIDMDIHNGPYKRYLRAVAGVASGSGGLVAAEFILGRGRYLPPTQEITGLSF